MPPARNNRAAIWDDLSPGVAVMLVGYMHMLVSDPGDIDEDLGMTYMLLGAELFSQQLEEEEEDRQRRRRGPYNKTRTQQFIDMLIELATERFFKSWFRVDRESFYALVELIKDDPVFAHRGR
ncbi:hypothetical protein FRC07_011536 [Ceratobasidium sp. 392]|nr:hypothetical protein FRC07_011536 [Ceratobasidium sp. 392]